MNQIPMTVRGLNLLKEELDFLKNKRRPEITEAIASARELGDLKENAEYHAAREQQAFCEGRIQEIEGKLANSQVIDVTKMQASTKVIFGSTVKLFDHDLDNEIQYKIVGHDESDLKQGFISINSPIARALIGRHEGDDVVVHAPNGDKEYEILEVLYV